MSAVNDRPPGDLDASEAERLFAALYDELRRLARHNLRGEWQNQTLQTSALINEAYLRLVDQAVPWQSRAHFFGIAARLMRQILVDSARTRQRLKRGGDQQRVTLDDRLLSSADRPIDVLALDQALERLASVDPANARLVELRFFGGLSVEETAEVLGVSAITVKREWLKAKAWLYREINQEKETGISSEEC